MHIRNSIITFLLFIFAQSPIFADPKICLTMIVKNEEAVMLRCLNGVKDIVDCISICDTGSTDHTINVIETFMKENHIPGKVHRHEWKNFGYNRTLSAKSAQHTLQELGFLLEETYLFLIDADMILNIKSDFERCNLKDDAYSVQQQLGNDLYYNVRFVRASLPWECVGVTHEYWSCRTPFRGGILDSLMLQDCGDGGCRSDKFERDLRLLAQGLMDEPDNERYMFYYAQTNKNLGKFEEAIFWFKAHIQKSSWKEEIWCSKSMIGDCYEALNDWDNALHWYLDAYEYYPVRAETLYKIARHYRLNNQNYLAYLFAKQGSNIPYPKNQALFVSQPVYQYQFDEELSITSFYTPYKEDGYEASSRLLLKKNIPDVIKQMAFNNLYFYVERLKDAHFQPIEFVSPFMRNSDDCPLEMIPLRSKKTLCEKKWLPFCLGVNLYAISSYDPFTVCRIDPEKGSYETLICYENEHDFSHYIGAAAPIEFDDGYLMIVYEAISIEQNYDTHRFVYLDKDFKIDKVSKPFIFLHKGLECCGNMAINPANTKCLISLGIENKEVYVCHVDLRTIRDMLSPLPAASGLNR